MYIEGFIDYFIVMQVFLMRDSACRNMVLYTKKDKKKFYPFFYDLDASWYITTLTYQQVDILEGISYCEDMSFWKKFFTLYRSEIISRYKELRASILTVDFITKITVGIMQGINYNDYLLETEKWQKNETKHSVTELFNGLENRLKWLDSIYLK